MCVCVCTVLEIVVGHQTFSNPKIIIDVCLNIFGFDRTKCPSRKLYFSFLNLLSKLRNHQSSALFNTWDMLYNFKASGRMLLS